MADRLARIYGTEEDKVNCPFYHKIGACRHGDRCSRLHNKPLFSQTVCLKSMFVNPIGKIYGDSQRAVRRLTPDEERDIQASFEDFYIDVWDEVSKFGEMEDLYVCDNLGDHLIGNVYVKYMQEEDAAEALKALHGRFYNGVAIHAEYSPVTEFREARCRQFDERGCDRGPWCNFMHLKYVPRDIKDELFRTQPVVVARGGAGGGGGRGRSRSPDPRDRDHPRDAPRGYGGGPGRDDNGGRGSGGGGGGGGGNRDYPRVGYDHRDGPPRGGMMSGGGRDDRGGRDYR